MSVLELFCCSFHCRIASLYPSNILVSDASISSSKTYLPLPKSFIVWNPACLSIRIPDAVLLAAYTFDISIPICPHSTRFLVKPSRSICAYVPLCAGGTVGVVAISIVAHSSSLPSWNCSIWSMPKNHPLSPSLNLAIADIGKRAGLSGVRVSSHTFRHTFARMYLDNGGDVYKLSRSLRYSEIRATEEYLKDFNSCDASKEHDAYSPVNRLKQAKNTHNKKSDSLYSNKLQRRCWRGDFWPFIVVHSACEALGSIRVFPALMACRASVFFCLSSNKFKDYRYCCTLCWRACKADGGGIDGCGIIGGDGAVAQWIEHRFPKPCVGGSSPLSPTSSTRFSGGFVC